MARTAIHPGEHLAEAIAAIGTTAAQLARDVDVPPNRITGILHGTRGITADTALRLGRYFETSAAFWMNLQQIYDLRRAEQEIGDGLALIPTQRGNRGAPAAAEQGPARAPGRPGQSRRTCTGGTRPSKGTSQARAAHSGIDGWRAVCGERIVTTFGKAMAGRPERTL
jgi:addiction module HigA family antidote